MSAEYRLYTFVAGLYLSPLQCGLQSIHVCSELYANHVCYSGAPSSKMKVFDAWAAHDKTVIICNARTSAGVKEVYALLSEHAGRFELPCAIFYEDAESLDGATTAAGIIVPDCFWDVAFDDARPPLPASYTHSIDDKVINRYEEHTPEYNFIKFLKSFPLA